MNTQPCYTPDEVMDLSDRMKALIASFNEEVAEKREKFRRATVRNCIMASLDTSKQESMTQAKIQKVSLYLRVNTTGRNFFVVTFEDGTISSILYHGNKTRSAGKTATLGDMAEAVSANDAPVAFSGPLLLIETLIKLLEKAEPINFTTKPTDGKTNLTQYFVIDCNTSSESE